MGVWEEGKGVIGRGYGRKGTLGYWGVCEEGKGVMRGYGRRGKGLLGVWEEGNFGLLGGM